MIIYIIAQIVIVLKVTEKKRIVINGEIKDNIVKRLKEKNIIFI